MALDQVSGAGGPTEEDGELQHFLLAAGSEPVLITPGQSFTLGRKSDCELVIPSKRVSRRHALIYWERTSTTGRIASGAAACPLLKNLSTQGGTLRRQGLNPKLSQEGHIIGTQVATGPRRVPPDHDKTSHQA